MKRLVLIILTFAALLPGLAQAYDVLILQSRRDPAYDEVLSGFRSRSTASQRLIIMSDYTEVDIIRIVREEHPKLVLALGDAAVSMTRAIQRIPVLAVMSLDIHTRKNRPANFVGISMFMAPERYLDLFSALKVRRVGIVHDPANSGWYLSRAREAAINAGIELVIREVASPRETPAQLDSLRGRVDALWMLPDTTAVTRETVEAWFRFGQEQNLPMISFAYPYLGLGATAVLEINRRDLGKQAAETSASLLQGTGVSNGLLLYSGSTVLRTNARVLKRLGLILPHWKQ